MLESRSIDLACAAAAVFSDLDYKGRQVRISFFCNRMRREDMHGAGRSDWDGSGKKLRTNVLDERSPMSRSW